MYKQIIFLVMVTVLLSAAVAAVFYTLESANAQGNATAGGNGTKGNATAGGNATKGNATAAFNMTEF